MDKNIVFNSDLERFGQRNISGIAKKPVGYDPKLDFAHQKARLFEQLLLFDKVAIKTDHQNIGLRALIEIIGLNKTEELLDKDIIRIVLWRPAIFANQGLGNDDGEVDHSTVIGTPPIYSGTINTDPEKNIDMLFQGSDIHKSRIRIFKKVALKRYLEPKEEYASNAKSIIIDAYKNNRLKDLGLEFIKEPEQLDYLERQQLLILSHDILETAFLAEFKFKSYSNYSYFSIAKSAMDNIGIALKVSNNTSKILTLESVPEIEKLIMENKVEFDSIFNLRYESAIKEYRRWINVVSSDSNLNEITKEYINAISYNKAFANSNIGKVIRAISVLTVGAGISSAISSTPNQFIISGALLSKGADLGLGLFDSFILENIVRGWNPRMFVNKVEKQIN